MNLNITRYLLISTAILSGSLSQSCHTSTPFDSSAIGRTSDVIFEYGIARVSSYQHSEIEKGSVVRFGRAKNDCPMGVITSFPILDKKTGKWYFTVYWKQHAYSLSPKVGDEVFIEVNGGKSKSQ